MTRLFGTNGIRWIVGDRKGAMFPVRLGLAGGTHFGAGSRLCLGMDTRTTSPLIFNAVTSGLLACGCDVVNLGIVPTPLLQFAIPRMNADGGIMVTASHNPPEFNGLKCMARNGTEISKADERNIEDLYGNGKFALADWQGIGSVREERRIISTYKKAIVKSSPLSPGKEPFIIVDCANATASLFTPDILTAIGCRVITLNAQPDGRFPGRLPEPTKENIGSLMTAVKDNGADFGVAHDGDADRAVFVDENGEFVTGDQSLAIFVRDALQRSGKGCVVTAINTSKMVSDVVEAHGGKLELTPIGSPLIAGRMRELEALIGGEGNGGVIFPEHLFSRDGMMTSTRMTQILSGAGKTLSEMVAALPKYNLQRDRLRLPDGISKEAVMERVKAGAEGEVTEIDGLKMSHDDHWVLVRFSGTEAILRITVESDSSSKTSSILEEHKNRVEEIIDSLSS